MNELENKNGNSVVEEKSLVVTEEMKSDLFVIIRWGGFLNVIGAVSLAFIVLCGIPFLFISGKMPAGIVYLLFGAVGFFPLQKSFAFVRQARYAIEVNDNEEFGNMFKSLRFILKYWGICVIVYLCFLVVCIVALSIVR